MVQQSKVEVVKQTIDRLDRSGSVVVVGYKGLTVAELSDLRNQLREVGGELKVIKNRLTKRALAEAGCEPLDEMLTGPVALAFAYDEPVGPPKICAQFAKANNKLVLKGGLLEKCSIDAEKVMALAKLPGRTELLSQMAATIMAPARQIVTSMNQALSKIVYAMNERADQMEA